MTGLFAALVLSLVFSPVIGRVPGEVQYERKGGDPDKLETFPPAIFQHWNHRIRYRCDVCHDSLFTMQQDEQPVTHESMKEDRFCGACHDGRVAFDAGFENCHRCHNIEKK